jgi:hypothetical protein
LADYLSVSNNIRPVIVKLHHDYLLSPKNTEQDTNTLPPEFKKNLPPVLGNCGFNTSNSSSSISSFLLNFFSCSWYFFACLMAFLTSTLSSTLMAIMHSF